MTANRLKERLNSGKPCINGWLLLPSTFSAEVMAQTGWDSLTAGGFGHVKWRNLTQTEEIKTRLIGRFRAMTADSKAGV